MSWLVVGATARTILSIGLLGTPPDRATRDIDIAIAVDSWTDFHALTATFPRQGCSVHSFVVEGVPVDVVPFGGIEREDRTILWADNHRMNTLGLAEALTSAEEVLLPGGLTVRVPSVPSMVLLKLLAWRDRRNTTTRDAIDLAIMIRWYSSGIFYEQLFEHHLATVERYDYDSDRAGAWVLGSQIASLLDPAGMITLQALLRDTEAVSRLAADMRIRDSEALANALVDGVLETAE